MSQFNISEYIENKARAVCPRIIFPESYEVKILEVVEQTVKSGIAQPVLIGDLQEIDQIAREHQISLDGVMFILPSDELKNTYAERFEQEHPEYLKKMSLRKFRDPLYLAACAVHFGDADSFVAGFTHSTGEVILAASTFIGLARDNHTVSSFNIVTIPGFEGSEGENVVFTDVAVCVDPTPEKLADIASLTADAVSRLLDWEPRVAMLSYSTKGSGESDLVDKVTEGLQILKTKRPDIKADGEFQLEVALSRKAAEKKLKDEDELGEVAGQANIIVFPDINAGNTNIKAVKLFSGANSIGPILTGFAKPVSDLSRTGSVKHIVGTVATVAALCEKEV